MSVSPLSNSYNNNYLTNRLFDKKIDADETANTVLGQYKSPNNAYSAYGANMYAGVGQNAMQRAIEELKAANDGKITFNMVQEHRAKLEEEFKKNIQLGLALLGFEKTEDFQLTATPKGEVEITCEDPKLKEAVNKLLQESKKPNLKEQFLYIQSLGNIERAKGGMSSYLEKLHGKASLQADSLDLLLNGGDFINKIGNFGIGYSSLLANFNNNSVQYMLGANYLV